MLFLVGSGPWLSSVLFKQTNAVAALILGLIQGQIAASNQLRSRHLQQWDPGCTANTDGHDLQAAAFMGQGELFDPCTEVFRILHNLCGRGVGNRMTNSSPP